MKFPFILFTKFAALEKGVLQCVIFCPTNEKSLILNEEIVNKLSYEPWTYLGADEVVANVPVYRKGIKEMWS